MADFCPMLTKCGWCNPYCSERIKMISLEKCKSNGGTVGRFSLTIPAPHGRLIDADALMGEFERAQRTMQQHGREYSCSFLSSSQELSTEWYCVEDILENAPTIIPAEEVVKE